MEKAKSELGSGNTTTDNPWNQRNSANPTDAEPNTFKTVMQDLDVLKQYFLLFRMSVHYYLFYCIRYFRTKGMKVIKKNLGKVNLKKLKLTNPMIKKVKNPKQPVRSRDQNVPSPKKNLMTDDVTRFVIFT